ncbi:MAG TPA: GNAT family N-acetyltransferase, partial [Fontimonas sp.]
MTSSATDLHWRWSAWAALGASDVHDFLRLRSEIFVVEQQCAYQDIDGLDPGCRHLLVRDDAGRLLAYLRLLPAGLNRAEPALGRLVVSATARGRGLARAVVQEGVRVCSAA